MKQPKSPLPWKLEDVYYNEYELGKGQIEYSRLYCNEKDDDGYNTVLSNEQYYPYPVDKDNMLYILQSANNYPKALELLKELVEFGNQIPNNYGRTRNHYELLSRVDKFLKEQENE